jgi:Zn-dependent peptidase ImmA (M78 family)
MAFAKVPRERREFLAELAEDVWRTYSGKVPVFLDSIVEENPLTISFGDYGEAFEGLLEHRSGKFHIYLNTARGHAWSPRVRFTFGHELGHFFIDEHRNALAAGKPPHPSFPNRPSDNPAEQEANLFSSHLLMPTKEYHAKLKTTKPGLQAVRNIADLFQVSAQCSALRYVVNAGRPCAAIMFRNGAKPWWDVSPELEAMGLNWVRDIEREFPADFATAKAKAHDPKQPMVIYSNPTVADVWFSNVPSGGPKNIVMHEESMRLGQRGVLTLLSV